MKKISVVMMTTLLLLSMQDIEANHSLTSPGDNHIPQAVLYSLVQKYRGYTLISSKQVGEAGTKSYRAVVMGNGVLKEIALSPQGGIRGEVFLDGTPDAYRTEHEEIRLNKDFKRSLLANGFSKKTYRRNVDHRYEANSNRYSARFGYPYYYPYRYYYPRYYRVYRY